RWGHRPVPGDGGHPAHGRRPARPRAAAGRRLGPDPPRRPHGSRASGGLAAPATTSDRRPDPLGHVLAARPRTRPSAPLPPPRPRLPRSRRLGRAEGRRAGAGTGRGGGGGGGWVKLSQVSYATV